MNSSSSPLFLSRTCKFFVLGTERFEEYNLKQQHEQPPLKPEVSLLPVMKLSDLLLHRQNKSTEVVRNQLWKHLQERGFVILTLKKRSEPGQIVETMRQSLCHDFFPTQTCMTETRQRNVANLQSGHVYESERGIPMWRLGYELCDDIREAYRVHAGCPDSQPWPRRRNDTVSEPRKAWLRGLALCRHICDEALHLTLNYDLQQRPGSGMMSWKAKSTYSETAEGDLSERQGDFSVLYAMHYFNDNLSQDARLSGNTTGTSDVCINVKAHVDPSLFVLEPFLAEREGLQVYSSEWITCDGPSSPIQRLLNSAEEDAMVLFVGRAFAANSKIPVEATLHRVVAPESNGSRRTMIYEQKYEEYFPPPTLD